MHIKVCGMTRQQDLDLAASLGVGLCGFIFHPKSPRYIEPAEVAKLESHGMLRVGVFVKQTADEIAETIRTARLDLAQFHGNQDIACAQAVGVHRVVRVLWPDKYEGNAAAFQSDLDLWQGNCRAFLLDAGKSGGGNGVSFNRSLLSQVRLPHPWFLAGGLGMGFLPDLLAIPSEKRPDGLDFNSGLEDAPGKKNAGKLRCVLEELRNGGLEPEPFALN